MHLDKQWTCVVKLKTHKGLIWGTQTLLWKRGTIRKLVAIGINAIFRETTTPAFANKN